MVPGSTADEGGLVKSTEVRQEWGEKHRVPGTNSGSVRESDRECV